MTGAYVSEDGGSSWREFNLRSMIRSFAFDPADPDVVYAAGDYLWRSDDRGGTWNLVYPVPQTVTAVTFPGDDEAVTAMITTHGLAPALDAFRVDSNDPQILYLCVGQSFLISHNRGQSWALAAKLPGRAQTIHLDPSRLAAGRKIFLVGTNWTAIWDSRQLVNVGPVPGISKIRASAVGFQPESSEAVIYVVSDLHGGKSPPDGGLICSQDYGRTWKTANASLLAMRPTNSTTVPFLSAIVISPKHPNTVFLSFSNLQLRDGRTVFGLARSVDGASSWQLLWNQTNTPVAAVSDAWASETFGPEWPEDTQALALDEHNPGVIYKSDLARTMKSSDEGKTWTALYSRKSPGAGYISTGIDVTSCYGIHFDPFHPNRQFLSCTDIGLFRSEDGGRHWISSGSGIPRAWRNTTYWIAPDPTVEGRMWAACSGTHDLPRLKMFRRVSPARFKGGVVITEDGGKSWKVSGAGMPETAVTHILIDPQSPPEHRVLYAAAMGRGVYKSSDGGATWTLKNNGLTGGEPMAWRLTFDSKRTLYLVVIRRSEDGSYGNSQDGMIYRSTDGAEHWQRVPLPAGVNGPMTIAIDPQDAKRIYVASWPRYNALAMNPPRQGGLWLSSDGGGTWRNTHSEDQYLYDVTVSPHDPSVLFASGFQSSIWRSGDRGETWRRIRGFNFKAPYRVIPDPFHPDMIYVTTYGSSVWYGPAKGDPRAVEDIVSPPAARYSH